jgi:hypothetical protein
MPNINDLGYCMVNTTNLKTIKDTNKGAVTFN